MGELAFRPWTVGAFFEWQQSQGERYELVGGFPLKMMTGASNRHDDIVVNTLAALSRKLRGGPCRPFTADGSVETLPGQIRRPDIGVDCGRRDPDDYKAGNPVAVFEVLSPSTRDFDRFRKIKEYMAVVSMRHIVFVETLEPLAYAWTRGESGEWTEAVVRGLDAVLPMTAIGIELPLLDIYQDIRFPDPA